MFVSLVLFVCSVVCFFTICSTSPPGGNQVDGLPPAASFHEKISDSKSIKDQSEMIQGPPGHQKNKNVSIFSISNSQPAVNRQPGYRRGDS